MEQVLEIPWGHLGPGLTMVAISLSGTFGVIKAYFGYRIKVIELQHSKNHEIEDRRAQLEEDRKKTNSEWLTRFSETVSSLRTEIQSLKARLDTVEPKVQKADELIPQLMEKIDRVNAWLDKYKRSDATVIPGGKSG